MIVTLNSYIINDNTNNVYLDVEIDGLSLPPIRTSKGDYAGSDGGFVGAQFYSARDISLQGRVFSSDINTLENTRRAFQNALAGKDVTLLLTTNAGASFTVFCKLVDFQMPIMRDLFSAPFHLELLAPDPVIYDGTGSHTVTLPRLAGGGLTWPLTWPLTWSAGAGATIINNLGSVDTYPVITLTGSMTAAQVTNQTTQQVLKLTSLTTSPGDVVVIDMKNQSVLLNGGNIFSFVTTDSSFWSLAPGNNRLTLTTTNGADTVSGTVSWMPGYMGI